MLSNHLRLIALALLVFLVVPYLVLRHTDKAEQARQSRAGKTVIMHYWGIPDYAQSLQDQITISVYRRFLDKPENRDVIIDKFSGLEIIDLPASWDAMMQMAFAADRAPDICELVTENIQTHRDERFIRPLPDTFTFVYSNSAYDDLAGYPQDAVNAFRAEQRRQAGIYERALADARARGLADDQWLPQVGFDHDLALMLQAQRMQPERLSQANHLSDLLDAWNDLMRRSGQLGSVTTQPDAEPTGEQLSPRLAWNRWLFEKTQARIPADLLRALYDLKEGKLYGADMGEPSLMGLRYRVRPFREAGLVDARGKPLLPQSWDELEFWSIAFSLTGQGIDNDGVVGYKLAHGQLIPYPFPLFAYGAGGQLVVPANPEEADISRIRWTCALDSPGTIRGMTWVQRLACLKPFKLDYETADSAGNAVAVPLIVVYSDKAGFGSVPDFYLRRQGLGRQVLYRRLVLTDDWRLVDGGRELIRFSNRQDLLDQMQRRASKVGPCMAIRAMDKGDLAEERRLWDEDKLAMTYQTAKTLVVDKPDAEGINRFPDGAAWDLMVTDESLKNPAALRQLASALARLNPLPIRERVGPTKSGPGEGDRQDNRQSPSPYPLPDGERDAIEPVFDISDSDWAQVDAFQKRLAGVKDPAERARLKALMPPAIRRVINALAAIGMPVDYYYPLPGLRPARPAWADATQLDRDRSGSWAWSFLVSPDGRTIVPVDRKYVIEREEIEAWPGGPRFTVTPEQVLGENYSQFPCGLQVPGLPASLARKRTWRIQVSVIDMGMLALNSRMNDRTEEDRKRLDAAARLIAYLSSDEAERIEVEKKVHSGLGLTINPILLRKYGYDDLAAEIPREYEDAVRNIRRIGRAVPPVPNYRGFQQFLASLGDRVIISKQDPATACREMTRIVNNRFLGESDETQMRSRRIVGWVIFGLIVAALATAGIWTGRQLLRGLSANVARGDDELGSVGQRPTWRTHLTAWIFLGPAVASIFVWSYVPLGWGSVMAFQDFHVIKPTTFVGLDNFIRIFIDQQFYRILGNTFYFVFLSLSLGFLAPVLLALMLHEIPFLKTFYRTVFYLPAITSGLVVMLMWKRFFDPDKEGLLNSLLLGLNQLDPAAVFAVKTAGVLAMPVIILLLYSLPLMDEIETRFGRFIAGLLPVGLTLWLGWRGPGEMLGGLGWPAQAATAALCLVGGLALLRVAYRCENEFASRRLPWAGPAIMLIFIAGWLARLGFVSAGRADPIDPNDTLSHAAQMFVLWTPILGVWPSLRRLFGREHTPRETMYLVLKAKESHLSPNNEAAAVMGNSSTPLSLEGEGAGVRGSLLGNPLHRLVSLIAGLALAAIFLLPPLIWANQPIAVAFKYLLAGGGGVGLLLHPAAWLAVMAIFAALVFKQRGRFAAVVLAAYLLLFVLAAVAMPTPIRQALAGLGDGWLLRPFVMEPLGWLKDSGLAMLCIILPGVWAAMGPGCLIYLAGLKSIPEDVYEAADLDGASSLQKVWTITVPHLLALLIINFVGAFIGAFQASQNVLVMTAGGPAEATMVLGLEVWLDAFVLLRFGYATALAWILGLILIGFTMYQVSILKKVQFKTSGMK